MLLYSYFITDCSLIFYVKREIEVSFCHYYLTIVISDMVLARQVRQKLEAFPLKGTEVARGADPDLHQDGDRLLPIAAMDPSGCHTSGVMRRPGFTIV